jgi:hypothetical protein
MAYVTFDLNSTMHFARQAVDYCGSNVRRVHTYEPAIWKSIWQIKWRQVGVVRIMGIVRRAGSERDQRPTKIFPVSYASQHDSSALLDPSPECVPGRACQTTRRGRAWPSGTQPDVRLPANRITSSYQQGRLQQFYEP